MAEVWWFVVQCVKGRNKTTREVQIAICWSVITRLISGLGDGEYWVLNIEV